MVADNVKQIEEKQIQNDILCTDLPHGFSAVVLSWKVFSKLYRLRTSSFRLSSSIQPLKNDDTLSAEGG